MLPCRRFLCLLTQGMKSVFSVCFSFRRNQHRRLRGKAGNRPITAVGLQPALFDDAFPASPGVVEQFLRFRAAFRILQDLRIRTFQLPAMEEGRPVDVRNQFGQRIIVEGTVTRPADGFGTGWSRWLLTKAFCARAAIEILSAAFACECCSRTGHTRFGRCDCIETIALLR